MSFYSRQLLSNPTLRTFWQAAYLPSLKRHDLKKHDVVQAGDKIAECADALMDLLTGKDWGTVAATLQGLVPSAKKQRKAKGPEETGPLPDEPPLIMMALRLPSQLLFGMVRVHARMLVYLQEDATHTLHALGIASEAAGAEAPPPSRRGLAGRKRRKAEEAAGQAKTLEEKHVDLHDIDITLPEFEDFLLEFPPYPRTAAPLGSTQVPSASAAGDASTSAGGPPSQPLLQAIPKEQPSQPIGEDLEGDEVFDEAAGPELAEFMLAPEPLLPRDLRTPAIPPTQPLFGASTPGAPNRPLRGPLLPPPLTKTTTTTSSSHYQRQGQLERSSHHHHTERRTLFGVPEEMALPHTVEVSPGTQITLPPYPTFEEGLAQKAYGPTYGLVSPSVSTAGAADVAAARKEAVSSEELVPFVYGPVPDHDNEATYAYAAGDQAAYEEDAEGGVEAPRLRGATVLGKRSRSEEVAEASTEEMEPGMLEVPEAMQPSQEGAELAAEAAVAHAAAVAGAEAKHRAEGKRERERVRRATGKGPFGMALHPLKKDGVDTLTTVIRKQVYQVWTNDRAPVVHKRLPKPGTHLSTPVPVPPAAMSALDPRLAMSAVDTAVQGGKVIELLTPSQPLLHTTEVPMELFPEEEATKTVAAGAKLTRLQRAHAAQALAGLSAWVLVSDEQGAQPGAGACLSEELRDLYRHAVQGPPLPPPTPSPPPSPRAARFKPQVTPPFREVPVSEEQLEMERQERQQMARGASEDLLHRDRLAEDTGASIESAARLGQQKREHGDMEYEEPATGYDEYEAMVESQQPLELPGSQAAEEQQKQLRHATQLPMTKEVQQLAYTRMPHRTRAAAGMLRAAFKELQGPEEEEVELDLRTLVAGRSRLSAARWFTDVIALQGCGLLVLDQDVRHEGPITLHPRPELMQAARA